MIWQTARGTLELGNRAVIMGILNVTPDSFSDGGKFLDVDSAVKHALAMFEDGAGIVDIGGESTRPGSAPVTAVEERRRVIPVLEKILARAPAGMVSVDTSKSEVAQAALEAGAAIVNDVTALHGDAGMADVVCRFHAGLVLMHMQGTPLDMQHNPNYGNIVKEVRNYLEMSVKLALEANIAKRCIAVDPGIGFGKDIEHNLTLLRRLPDLRFDGYPLVVGISRKSFLSKVAGFSSMEERLWPTLALTALLRDRGAQVFRVHDVRANVAALRATEAVLGTV